MQRGTFFQQLFLLTLIVLLLLLALHQLPSLQQDAPFSWLSLAFFVLLSIVTYFIAYRSVQHKNKFAFVNASLVMTFVKMVLCIALVAAYIKLTNPPSRTFILPFLGIYVIYTIFETYFLMKIGKTK